MKLSEAIFIFERYGGGNSPLSSLEEYDRAELYAHLIGSKDEYSVKEQERAECLFKRKLAEYERDIERSNEFIDLLDIDFEDGPAEKIAGMNETLKYLSELSLYLARIGINYHELSVYEAHRLYALSYKDYLDNKEDN